MNIQQGSIKKAVFPVAGLGTRFLPATKTVPKEMLSIVDKPLIQYAVEEAYASGIREMIFITCNNKHAIEDYFDVSWRLESELQANGNKELLAKVQMVKPDDMNCYYISQPKPLGLGHAVLCAEKIIGNDHFAVILPDDLMISQIPVLKQLIAVHNDYGHNVLAAQAVPKELTNQYGIIQGELLEERLLNVMNLIEKPAIHLAPTNIAVVGRYILSAQIFKHIKALGKPESGEIQLTDAINSLLKEEAVNAYLFEGARYDCGSLLGFLQANVDFGKIHPSIGKIFTQWLEKE